MCGIAGMQIAGGNSPDRLDRVGTTMAARLAHRGPDDSGTWIDASAGLVLAHRRLAIVDLSPAGHQPMSSASGRYVLVFNGEIYNHAELRRELELAGLAPNWRGRSDTETLLAGFVAWGLEATLERTIGMFALALWDRHARVLSLARDRMGEKPLYYGWAAGGFVFASELKAIRAIPGFDNPVDRSALSLYMQFCAVPAPYSIYRDIRKLLPATIVRLGEPDLLARHLPNPVPYWSMTVAAQRGLNDPIRTEAEAVEEIERALRQSVAAQMIADVPLGAFLSGGVDSSTIVALMQSQSVRPVRTFTIGFDEAEFDESGDAARVAHHLATDHHEIRISPSDAMAVIPRLPEMYDEPFADSSQIPTYLVAAAARAQVTVALSGDGGDELFGGYNRYVWGPRVWKQLGWAPNAARDMIALGLGSVSDATWSKLGKAVPGVNGLPQKAQKLARSLKGTRTIDDLYRNLLSEWPAGGDIVRGVDQTTSSAADIAAVQGISAPELRMMLLDASGYMPDDILTKVDRAAMACALETRAPFLDSRLFELAWRLPLGMRIRGGQGKWALRQVLYKYVPRSLIERPKAGFRIPLGEWLRGPLKSWAEDLLDESLLGEQGFFDVDAVLAKWRQHVSGRRDWSQSIWAVLMFQAWLAAQHDRVPQAN